MSEPSILSMGWDTSKPNPHEGESVLKITAHAGWIARKRFEAMVRFTVGLFGLSYKVDECRGLLGSDFLFTISGPTGSVNECERALDRL